MHANSLDSTAGPLKIGIVVGEKSGDALGAGLISAIKKVAPDALFSGLGGPAMLAQGFVSLAEMERLSVMGIIEPLKRLPELVRIRRQLFEHFLNSDVDIVVGIDSPDFNLGLEKKLKARGIVTCHYVCPSVWAWRQGRVKKIRAGVDHVLALLPFEVDFLQAHGVQATFVGHPLADRILGQPGGGAADAGADGAAVPACICIMPGSRRSEVDALLDLFLQTALVCKAHTPALKFIIPAATAELHASIAATLARAEFSALQGCVEVRQCFGQDAAQACMREAGVVLLASGTATLEAALLRVPMVVAYRISRLSYAIASRLVRVEHFSLPNLLLKERVVPEFIQDQATPEHLGQALLELFHNPQQRQQVLQKFDALGADLARGADQRAASAVLSLCRPQGRATAAGAT